MTLTAGTRLGPYEITALIGSGGMGEVYRARDLRLERQVALKVLRPEFASDEDRLRRFEQEARAASALNHPNIVTIFDIGRVDAVAYYVMELVVGHPLRELMTGRSVTPVLAMEIAAQVADGLAKAHDAGIIHRDLKPENVLMSDDGYAKIVDFGIAKLLERPDPAANATSTPGVTTSPGVVLGTVGYMSPEQAVGGEIGVRSDVFSLSAILYEMLAGQAPFARPTPVQTMSAIIEVDPVALTTCASGVPAGLSTLVQQGLHKDPRERPDAKPLAHALRAIRARMPSTTRSGGGAGSRLQPGGDTDRRHVTIIEAELSDYSALVDSVGSEIAEDLHAGIERVFDACVSAHGGTSQNRGETLVALFGLHEMAEDDAIQAARAACEFREQARSLAESVGADRAHALPRIGITSGDVIVVDRDLASGGARVTGEAAQIVSKILGAAEGDEILVTSDMWRLVDGFMDGEAGPKVRIKGRGDGTGTFRILRPAAAQTRLEAEERRGLTTFAGRQQELALLRAALADTAVGVGRIVKIVGEPGMGKSRLLHEFGATIGTTARALRGRCLALSKGTRYLAFIDPLRQLLSSDGEERARGETILGRLREIDPGLEAYAAFYMDILSVASDEYRVPPHLQGADLSLAFREALAALFTTASARQPLALLLEDWQWADRASDELLQALAGLTNAHPLLVVVTSRPEALASDIVWQNVITLSGMDVTATSALAAAVLGESRVASGLAKFVHERSAGNPLFIEELCRTLRDEGHVRVESGVVELGTTIGAAHLPDTIQAVLRSRLDKLEPRVRDVVRTAAVIGREFSRAILLRVVAEPAMLARDLETLKTSRMILQIRLVPDSIFRFHHALLHDAAYQSLLLYQRRELHARVADAILQHHHDRVDDHSAALARHFAAAEKWSEAARHGITAARLAVDQNRFADARDLLEDVLDATTRGTDMREVRMTALLEQERVCEMLADRGQQRRLVDELLSITREHPERQHFAQALLRQGNLSAVEGRYDEALSALDNALQIYREIGDDEGIRHALRSISFARWQSGDFNQAFAPSEEALAISVALSDVEGEAKDRATLATLLRQQGRRNEALAQLERAVDILDPISEPITLAYVVHVSGNVYRALGLIPEAKRAFQRVIDLMNGVSLPWRGAPALMSLASIAVEEGDLEQSLRSYDEAAEIYRAVQHADKLAQVLKVSADLLAAMERHEAALARATESATLFARVGDSENEAAAWRLAAKTAEAIPTQVAEAENAWRRLAALQRAASSPSDLAETLLSLARLLRARRAPESEVLALYDEALAAAQGDESRDLEAKVWNARGILHWTAGQFEAAHDCYTQGLALARELGDVVHTAFLLNSLAATLKSLGRVDEARARFEEALRMSREAASGQVEAHALAGLGDIAREAGDSAMAATYYRESLALREVLGDRRGGGWMRARLAGALAELGQTDEARSLRAAARAIAESENDDRLRQLVGE